VTHCPRRVVISDAIPRRFPRPSANDFLRIGLQHEGGVMNIIFKLDIYHGGTTEY
jgi:hypothetical protein